jgi:RNase P subunit RPR2
MKIRITPRYSLFFNPQTVCEKCDKTLAPKEPAHWHRFRPQGSIHWICLPCHGDFEKFLKNNPTTSLESAFKDFVK